jgi:inorganic pyrophosphatase
VFPVHALDKIPPFDENGVLRMIVESPKGATVKLKYEPRLCIFRIKRSLPLGLAYPFDWGFVPGTRGADGDPIDALSIHGTGTFPGVLTSCRALGMVRMEQKGPTGRISNPRVIVTPTWLSRPEEMSQGLSQQYRAEIEQFFATAGFFAAAEPKILGWSSAEEAEVHIRENSIELASQD